MTVCDSALNSNSDISSYCTSDVDIWSYCTSDVSSGDKSVNSFSGQLHLFLLDIQEQRDRRKKYATDRLARKWLAHARLGLSCTRRWVSSDDSPFRGFLKDDINIEQSEIIKKLIKQCLPRLVLPTERKITRKDFCGLCNRRYYNQKKSKWIYCEQCKI